MRYLTHSKLLSIDYVSQLKICPRQSSKASRAENGFYLYFRREIVLSEDETLIPVTKWNGEARFLKNTTDPLQFACEDGNGGCQIVKLSEEEVCYFFLKAE